MKKIIIIAVIAIVVVGVGIVLLSQDNKSTQQNLAGTITNDLTHVPGDNELTGNLSKAGLDTLSAEGTVLHIHQHLDMIINGQVITIPAHVGIGSNFISPIHTHDETGIIHVESPVIKDFKLSQFFTEWGIDFTDNCIGTNCVDGTHQLVVAVNGTPVTHPTDIVLHAHDEIEVWYGDKTTMPTSFIKDFSFPQGL